MVFTTVAHGLTKIHHMQIELSLFT